MMQKLVLTVLMTLLSYTLQASGEAIKESKTKIEKKISKRKRKTIPRDYDFARYRAKKMFYISKRKRSKLA